MGMKVGQVMNRPVLATSPHSGVRGIALFLIRAGISGMPVADTEGNIVGIVTEYDLVNVILEEKKLEELKAEDIMQTETITLDVEAEISEALKIFKEKHIVRVPVTENGKLVGILSRIDALKGILEEPEFMLFWEQMAVRHKERALTQPLPQTFGRKNIEGEIYILRACV